MSRQARRRLLSVLVGPLVLALSGLGLAACGSGGSGSTMRAVFASADNLYTGNPVEVLGVREGTVTKVEPDGNAVLVTFHLDPGVRLPADVEATLVNPQVLGTPSVELGPGYQGGPSLAPGSTIPESRTVVPVSINQLLVQLQTALRQINPQAVGGTVSSLAQDLAGQGLALRTLIERGAGTLSLLAQKGNQLGQLDGSLAAITGTLRQQTSQLTTLLQDYDTVAGVLNANRQPLAQAIEALAQMSQQLALLLSPNLVPLQQDIATITQVGRTLDRNLPTLDQLLSSSDRLFAGAQRAYDPVHNWLNLNIQLDGNEIAGQEVGLVRDLLASICRRVLANHSSGLSSQEKSTLSTCGNPASGFFDPILGLVPKLLAGQAPSAPSAQQLLNDGLAEIPGLTTNQRGALSQLSPSQLAAAGATSGGGGSGTGGSGTGSSADSVEAPTALHPAAPVAPPSSSGGLLGGLVQSLFGALLPIGGAW
jgi:phospholipid/cholesterol/gamma-HCH transport system substrate-binding protein